jgi:hypothetical protein
MVSGTGTALKRVLLAPRSRDLALPMRGDARQRFRRGAKLCSIPIIILLAIAALGPAKWVPRTEFGWQFDHFIGYFGITLFFCFAWPRPVLISGAFAALAALLEGLQAFTPDRTAYLPAILYGAGGAVAAGLVVAIMMRGWKRISAVWMQMIFVDRPALGKF